MTGAGRVEPVSDVQAPKCARACSEMHRYDNRCAMVPSGNKRPCRDEYDEMTECHLPIGHDGDHETWLAWP